MCSRVDERYRIVLADQRDVNRSGASSPGALASLLESILLLGRISTVPDHLCPVSLLYAYTARFFMLSGRWCWRCTRPPVLEHWRGPTFVNLMIFNAWGCCIQSRRTDGGIGMNSVNGVLKFAKFSRWVPGSQQCPAARFGEHSTVGVYRPDPLLAKRM